MPIGKIQRKASSETLSSIDGTLDSRLSSTDIPKMELLKINYVHQCKQAIMTKTEPTMHPTPPPLQRLQKATTKSNSNQGPPSTNGGNFKFAAYKKPALTATTHAQQHNLSNLSPSSRKLATNCQPLPPPTIESWQFLQNKRALNSPPKQLPSQKSHVDINTPCHHSIKSSNCSDSDQCQTDSTLSPGCERSNSWDYRSKVSTCDIRRDIARAGIKSRADRIARIEKTECEHRQQNTTSIQNIHTSIQNRVTNAKQSSLGQNETQINTMSEQPKQQPTVRESVEMRRRALTPPQPKRQAPILVLPPMKVPNARKRGVTPPKSNSNGHDRIFRRYSQEDSCKDCNCRPLSPPIETRHSLGYHPLPTQVPDNAPSKLLSRIPKPISGEVGNRSSTSSAMFFSEASEQLQHKVQTRFPLDHQQTKSTVEKTKTITSASQRDLPLSNSSLEQLREKLPKHSRQQSSNHNRTKVERIHIRKKRQPLLIINQLTNEQPKNFTENATPPKESQADGQSCGYKNCNFVNCPMSAQSCDTAEDTELTDKIKRLSLGSNSDSGISSEDHHQLKENNFKNTTKKCSDCEEILRKQSAKNAACARDIHSYAMVQKLSPTKDLSPMNEACEIETGKQCSQVNITVGKQTDLNDVQNFAKKSLTKATTDEIITAAINSSISKGVANKASKSKQCNIDNDLKNNEQRGKINNNQRKQSIQIDDNWVDAAKESAAKSTFESSRISGDNCVTIFVRSADDDTQNKRASAVSTRSFASNSSSSSTQSDTTATASASSSSSASSTSSTSCASASSTASMTSGSSCCGGFSSGCGQSSAADTQSLCDSEKDCCCHLAEHCHVAGIFFNKTMISNPDACNFDNCSAISPAGDYKERRRRESGTSATTKTAKIGCDIGGIFWNSNYFYNDAEAGDNSCCCSLSSCDDDNCSYYDDDCGSNVGTGGSIVDVSALDNDDDDNRDTCCSNYRRQHCIRQVDRIDKDNFAVAQQRRQQLSSEEQQQQRKRQMRLMRNSSAEMHLLRNNKAFRKTDVIHDMRPRSMDGVIDSGVSLNGDTGSSPDSIEHMQNQQDSEARRLKRGHVLSELLETERIYVNEMSSILKGYCDQMQSEELSHLVPASLQGKEDLLFGNLHELYTFHNEIFLKDLENCISTTELVALCFVQRRDTFYRLYSFYCQNIPRSDRLRETLVDTHLFLQECQKRLGHKLPLAAYLLKPVQRITKYQLLLKDLLRFSDSGSCTKELQKALDCMLIVLKCVNDSMHQVAITGFPSDLAQQGELLLQDSFQVWTESKKDIRLRIKPQQRHIFLYQKSMLFCKQTSKTGHNKSTYQFKHYLKMSQIGLTESVRGDVKRFEVWLQGRQEVHTLQAPTLEIKNKWVAEIKRVLLNQLEELKGEKIKQYGLNHRGLRQTTSWDTPNIIMGTPQRTISCDGSSESSNRNSNCSSSGDDNCCTTTPGALAGAGGISLVSTTSTATTDKDAPPDVCGGGWSSDYSNSEDEMSTIEDNSTPGTKFIALADYVAMGHSEVSMREGDSVELLKVGCAGWWFVRVLEANAEGWTPAAYLESFNRKSSRSSSRNQERMNVQTQKQ